MILIQGKSLLGKKKTKLKAVRHAAPVRIGSGSDQDVVLDDPHCAESHALIWYWDDCFVLLDKDTEHGTFLNGEKIETARLNPGSLIKIGDTELRTEPQRLSNDATMSR
ncbi:FHA domain-containing protein [Verrucomicrobiota bacterium]